MAVLGKKKAESFVSEEDTCILEDQSGRMKIGTNEVFLPQNFVSGMIVALKGRTNVNGAFQCEDYCFSGYAP